MSVSSVCTRSLRISSAKLQQLDLLLTEVRNKRERALIFCQMPQMLNLLQTFFKTHHIKFLYIQNNASNEQKIKLIELFSSRKHILVLLTSTCTSPPPSSKTCLWPNNLSHVVFFDSNWNNSVNPKIDRINKKNTGIPMFTSLAPCLAWCRQLNQRMAFVPITTSQIRSKQFTQFQQKTTYLKVYRLVCEDTVEDSISKKTLQQKLLGDLKVRNHNAVNMNESTNEQSKPSYLGNENVSTFWKIKRQTLEDLLFNNQHPQALLTEGDNGIFNTKPGSVEGDKVKQN